MAYLTLSFLGGFQANLADKPITAFESNKVRGLLAYLAVEATGIAHSRSSLAELLWPGYGEENARASLRQTLHHLRKSLGDDHLQQASAGHRESEFLLVTRQTIQFNPSADTSVDVTQFSELLAQCRRHDHPHLATCSACLPRLRQAEALYRGDFLAGFAVDDSTDFEEWRRYKQEELHIQALNLLETLADAAEVNGDLAAARHYARRLIDLESWRETAHRRLIQILARSGDRRAAIAQYHACRQIVKQELGAEPEPETVALYEQIRHAHPAEPEHEVVQDTLVVHNSLPEPSSQFVGRHEALAAIQGLFPRTRLVTLTGPSGSGKTRLAIAAAAALNSDFADGVCMVELASVSDPAWLPQAVAQALGQSAPLNPEGDDSVANYLRSKRLLLVLDNCEHLLESAAHWSKRWLSACPHLCILATSHGPLHVVGEHVWPVSALSYPPTTSSGFLPAQLMTFEAVQLFVARAQEVRPAFALTETNADAIVQICQRLEGIPLALELAAARVKLLTPAEIAERLKQCMDAAIAAKADAASRHQTMRAALSWSFDLLEPAEQTLLLRLAVFTGGFDFAAAEAVVKMPNVLELLSHLIDKSLVTAEVQGDQTRYRMLGVIREYAQDKLAESGEAQSVRQRYLAYFLQLVEHAQSDPQADGEALWLQPEADNLGSVLNWALATDNHTSAVRIAGALTWYWWMRGYLNTVRDPLRQALAHLDRASYSVAPTTLPLNISAGQAVLPFAAGGLLAMWDEPAKARVALAQALLLAEQDHDWPSAGLALRRLVGVAIQQKEYQAANDFIARGLAIWQALGGTWHIAWLYAHQGDLAYEQGNLTQAWFAYEASTKLPVNPGARAYPFRRMAYLALARTDPTQALTLCRMSLELNLASGDRQGIAACMVGIASMNLTRAQTMPTAVRTLVARRAAQLLGAVDSLLKTVEGHLLQSDELVYQKTTTRLREQLQALSPEAYVTAIAEGQAMVLEQAIAFALQEDGVAVLEESLHQDKLTSWPSSLVSASNQTAFLSPAPSLFIPSHSSETMTPFIGREDEVTDLVRRLQEPGARLLTLAGPGGMGKTRLALEVGRVRQCDFVDGVFFVPLASISTPAALVGTIASALGITLQGADPRRILLQMLRQKHLLLILDNFEHLLAEGTEAVDFVVELMGAAPTVQIIVTSRERLNLHGEELYAVPALTFSGTSTLAEAAGVAAVRLFIQSVQRVQADFQLTTTNLAAVLRICRLVEGMPLGLELAAANAGGLPLTAIADAIEQSADFLTVEWRDLPERQRSMRAVFASSWRLLSAEERRVLRQSAVFRGGFDYCAAQTVTGATPPLLKRLTEKSLLQWRATATGEGRYAMHELLRQFAAEELYASDERALVEERHDRYYLAFLAARGLRLGRGEPKEASAEIQVELDNVRLAWQLAATQGHLPELEQATYGWWQFCQLQGLEAEARQSFAIAIAGVRQQLAASGQDAGETLLGRRLLAKLLAIHADLLFAQGCDEEMAAQAREAMELGAASGGVEGETFASFVLGRALQELEQYQAAGDQWRQTLQLLERHQPDYPQSEVLNETYWMTHNWLRGDALRFGDYHGARAHLVQALQHAQSLGKRQAELYSFYRLGHTDYLLFDFTSAESNYRAALDLARAVDSRRLEMNGLYGLGEVSRLRGDYTTARTHLDEAVTWAAELALPYDEDHILAALVRLHCQVGDQAAAVRRYEQLIQLLARVKLAKECQLNGYLAAAVKSHYAGDIEEALRYAEKANEVNEHGGDILFRLVDTALILGHARAAVGQWERATAAFQQALDAFTQLGNQAMTAEPLAGLAQIALAQGDLAGAKARVEAILPVLAEQPRAGYNNPFFIYVTCYRVLTANADSRAATLLQQGYELLQQDAATLDDEARQRFLAAVPIHRDLITAYHELGAQDARVASTNLTSVEVTGPLLNPTSTLDWERMPTLRQFHGRERELVALTDWVSNDHCRLVLVLGIGGVGKTALVTQVVRSVAGQFAGVIWSPLLNAPPLGEILRQWLRVLTQPDGITPPAGEEEQIRLLMECLQKQRWLLVLDNVESILCSKADQDAGAAHPAGTLRPGYEGYSQLFNRLSQGYHRSCLLITSRELPRTLSSQTQSIQLLSLAGLDVQAGRALLQAHGLAPDDSTAPALVNHYSGNPLALQIVSSTIADLYNGDIRAFTAEGTPIFDDIRTVLDQQFARLSSLESEMLHWLAIERVAITPAMLRKNLVEMVPQGTFVEALRALQRRSLLEKVGDGFTLQNVIIEYLTDRLVEAVSVEVVHGKVAKSVLPWQGERTAESPAHFVTGSLLNRHALLKAGAAESVRQSQVRLILRPIAERLLAKLGEKQLFQQVRSWLDWLRAAASPQPGYAAGNLLNLLLHLNVDVAGLDFSGLSVWQADLRGAYVPELDFTNSDLSGSVFTHRFGDVLALRFGDAGDLAVASLGDGALRVWQAVSGELYKECSIEGIRPSSGAWSNDGRIFALADADSVIHLFDVAAEQRVAVLTGPISPIWRICFSADGKQVACGDTSGQVTVWATSGELLHTLHGHANAVTGLAYTTGSMRQELLASGGVGGTVCLWNAVSGELMHRLKGHTGEVSALGFALNGKVLVTASHDFSIRLWDIESGRTLHILRRHTQPIRYIAVTPEGNLLATGSGDKLIYLWDVESGEVRHVLGDHAIIVSRLCFSPDEKTLATFDLNGTLCLWDVQRGLRVDTFPVYRNAIRSADFSPDQGWVVAGGADGALYLWKVDEPPPDTSLSAPTDALRAHFAARLLGDRNCIATVAFSPDGDTLASGDTGYTIHLRNLRRETCRTLHGHRSNIVALSFNADGCLLASGSGDGTLGVWATASGQRLHTLEGHSNAVTSCSFSPDGMHVASGSIDFTVRLWDAEHGELCHTLRGHTNAVQSVAYSANGQWLISSGWDQYIRVWDVNTAQVLAVWPSPNTVFLSLAVHPTAAVLAAGAQDHMIYLLDLSSGRVLGLLSGHRNSVDSVRFSRDGRLLLSASRDETVKLWQVDAGVGCGVCCQTLIVPGPYANMKIAGVTGISEAQKVTLMALGAVED